MVRLCLISSLAIVALSQVSFADEAESRQRPQDLVEYADVKGDLEDAESDFERLLGGTYHYSYPTHTGDDDDDDDGKGGKGSKGSKSGDDDDGKGDRGSKGSKGGDDDDDDGKGGKGSKGDDDDDGKGGKGSKGDDDDDGKGGKGSKGDDDDDGKGGKGSKGDDDDDGKGGKGSKGDDDDDGKGGKGSKGDDDDDGKGGKGSKGDDDDGKGEPPKKDHYEDHPPKETKVRHWNKGQRRITFLSVFFSNLSSCIFHRHITTETRFQSVPFFPITNLFSVLLQFV
jgi:hypothetical protein